MSPTDLDRLCLEAMQRITYAINRMAAQQSRRMREGWAKPGAGK
jgi:hypothetical protein